eukprot:TRINITY_DN5755_c0_g3_i1.p1 TRINITY_DN5755_c0_g3~~TRINITY_DN5755_c0_g3_i1.p1  ORF type:complete len:218 (-),score=5.07 TRINITY_DN5755_c0_g3_i1:61-714(-)
MFTSRILRLPLCCQTKVAEKCLPILNIPNAEKLCQITKTRKLWFGIDPDVNGAIAVVHINGSTEMESFKIDFIDMPASEFVRNKAQKGKGRKIEGFLLTQKLQQVVQDLALVPQVVMEQPVGAVPIMSRPSIFRMAYNAGICSGVLQGLGFHLLTVSPRRWKADMNLLRRDKDISRQLALHIFPQTAELLKRKKRPWAGGSLAAGPLGHDVIGRAHV